MKTQTPWEKKPSTSQEERPGVFITKITWLAS
jgi:hypothetical protein